MKRLESMTEDEAEKWELEILSQHHKDQADRAVKWLMKQGYWIIEIESCGVREFELWISPANKRFKNDEELIAFAKSKGFVGTSRRPEEEER